MKGGHSIFMEYPEQLQDYALNEIRRRIQTGEYPGGYHLVSKTIADSLGISSTPVISAINRLAMMGLVELLPRRGAVVRKHTAADIRHFSDTRIMMERYAARHACRNVDKMPEVTREMHKAAEELATIPLDNIERISELENRFHSLFVSLAGNPQLDRLYNFNWGVGSVYHIYTVKNVDPENLRTSLLEHREILRILLSGDSDQLERILLAHLRFVDRAADWAQT